MAIVIFCFGVLMGLLISYILHDIKNGEGIDYLKYENAYLKSVKRRLARNVRDGK